MNTRAASILLFIFEIMAVFIVVYTAVTIAQRAGNSETVQKINVAEDVRMMVHTLAAVPGDAEVQYPHEVKHSVLLSGAVVSAFSPGDRETVWVKRKLVLPEGYTAQGVFDSVNPAEGQEERKESEKKKLCLQKKKKVITVHACSLEEPLEEEWEYEENLDDESDVYQPLAWGQTQNECFRENYGAYEENTVRTEKIFLNGKNFRVNAVMADSLRRVVPTLERLGYEVYSGNSCRYGTPSCGNFHASCLAIDINPQENPHCPDWAEKDEWLGRMPTPEEQERCRQGEIVTTIPREIVGAFENNGFYWGGRFRSPDPMHFEYIEGNSCCRRIVGSIPDYTPNPYFYKPFPEVRT